MKDEGGRMKRWFLWIGGGLLVGVLALLGLALFLGRSDAPFAFLEGHEPVQSFPMMVNLGRISGPSFVYSFRADHEALEKAIRQEMEGVGFPEAPIGPSLDPTRLRFVIPSEDPKRTGPANQASIDVFKDARMRVGAEHSTYEQGWVTVIVEGQRPPTFFDRLRAWLGL